MNLRPLTPDGVLGPRSADLVTRPCLRASPWRRLETSRRAAALSALAQVGTKPCARRWGCAATGGEHEGFSAQANLPGGRNAECRRRSCRTNLSMTFSLLWDIPRSRRRGRTYRDEFYGIAVRREGIESPFEFCLIDNLERDHNGADLALGHIDWMPGRGLTLANDPVQ